MPIKIKNWSSYQSYKDRKPPWIRFHKSMLDNYEYHIMTAEARALLPMLWLLASEDKDPVSGLIRDSYERVTFRLRMNESTFTLSLQELEKSGFIEIISEPQAIENKSCNEIVTDALRIRNQTVTPETETETETDIVNLVVSIWEESSLPKIRKLHQSRKKQIKARMKDSFDSIDEWRDYCKQIASCDFLMGKNDRNWRADFDWALKPENIAKVIEGKYSGNQKPIKKQREVL